MTSKNDDIFNEIYEIYSARDREIGKVLFSKSDWERTSLAYDLVKICPNIMDIGIGQGQLINLLSSTPSTERIVGVDFQKHTKLLIPDYKKFTFLQWDVTKECPLDHKPFDIIVAMEVLEHIDVEKLEGVISRLSDISKHRQLLATVPYMEKEPLYHHDKRHGHKQSFDNEKILSYFPTGSIISDLHKQWYVILTSDQNYQSYFVEISEFKSKTDAAIINNLEGT